MRKKMMDRVLSCTADAALDAFLIAMGMPSLGGSHEPKISDDMKAYKKNHSSKVEKLLTKLVG